MSMDFNGHLLSGEDYKLNDFITIHQPTLKEIFDYGEENYWSLVNILTASPSDVKSFLFDNFKLNFDQADDFHVFCILSNGMTKKDSEILFGKKFDLSEFKFEFRMDDLEMLLVNQKNKNIVIDRFIYEVFVEYIRSMHGYKRNSEKAGNDYTRQFLIDEDRDKLKNQKNKKFQSILRPYISFVCSMSLYSRVDVYNMPIFIFIDHMQQLLHNKHVDHLYTGIYSGTIDQKHVSKKDLSYIRE